MYQFQANDCQNCMQMLIDEKISIINFKDCRPLLTERIERV